MPILVLMRHGTTVWGHEGRFVGWADTSLNEAGRAEVRHAAEILRKAGMAFDVCLTSRLLRARESMSIVGESLQFTASEMVSDWRLNERHYGALQGETRAAMIERYGNDEVVAWRRSFSSQPPPLGEDDPRWLEQIARFPDIPRERQPRSESLGDAVVRIEPVWHERISIDLRADKNVLMVGHTSSMRALVRAIEKTGDSESAAMRFATAVPRFYEFDENLRVLSSGDLKSGLKLRLRYWGTRLKPRSLGRI